MANSCACAESFVRGADRQGEALVRMTNVEEAEAAIQRVNDTQPPGAAEKLTVRFAETLQEKIKRKQHVIIPADPNS